MKKNKGGRPPELELEWCSEEGLEKIREWALQYGSRTKIWKNMGVPRSSFYKLYNTNEKFKECIDLGDKAGIEIAENTILERMKGLKTVKEFYEVKDGEEVLVKKEVITQPGDMGAVRMYLPNKDKRWRSDNISVEHTIPSEMLENAAMKQIEKIMNGDKEDD